MEDIKSLDWESLLHPIIDPLVEHPSSVMIRVDPDFNGNNAIRLLIVAEDTDTARLVGKKGAVANALRDVVSMITKIKCDNEKVLLRFESFGGEEN